MKKYFLFAISLVAITLLIIIGFKIYFDSDYVSLDKYINGYEIFDNKENDPTCTMQYPYELFRTDEYVYIYYSQGCNISEYVVKVAGQYIDLSIFIEEYDISNDDIEKSGIGFRCYDCVEQSE